MSHSGSATCSNDAAGLVLSTRSLDRDRAYVVPGLGNSLNAHLTPRRPRRLVTAIAKLVTRSVLDTPAPAEPKQPLAA